MSFVFWGKVVPIEHDNSYCPVECPECGNEELEGYQDNDDCKSQIYYCRDCRTIYFRYGM